MKLPYIVEMVNAKGIKKNLSKVGLVNEIGFAEAEMIIYKLTTQKSYKLGNKVYNKI